MINGHVESNRNVEDLLARLDRDERFCEIEDITMDT